MEKQPSSTPDVRTLRRFGLTTGGVFAGLFGLLFPLLFGRTIPVWPWVLAVALILPALVYPAALRPVYTVWMKFAEVAGAVNTRIILGIVFFILVTPFGAVMRLAGRDPMRLRRPDVDSYRESSRPLDPKHMENPF